MSVERLGPLDPLSVYNKNQRTTKPESRPVRDSISVSDEAKLKAEMFQVSEHVRVADDVRAERVAEVKRRLQDPNYINDTIVEAVADRIMDVFDV